MPIPVKRILTMATVDRHASPEMLASEHRWVEVFILESGALAGWQLDVEPWRLCANYGVDEKWLKIITTITTNASDESIAQSK